MTDISGDSSALRYLPSELKSLHELAYNLWWIWNKEAVDLFRQADPCLWETTHHNPVLLLETVSRKRLEELGSDKEFLMKLEHVSAKFHNYMNGDDTWYRRTYEQREDVCIAYFSAEFGLATCLPIYSGGLGILAGDYLKSASDLGLPSVGVCLLYQQGYFSQYLMRDGNQRELYISNDFHNMPISLQRHEDGSPLTIRVPCATYEVAAQIWRAQIGRVPLILLDTNLPSNSAWDRHITDHLYSADPDVRIRQEILLGIGGFRALNALGLSPTVCHMNEGHAAFAALERIRTMMSEQNISFAEARERASRSNVFTTHTPVPAGIDQFPPRLMDECFCNYYPQLGLSRDDFLALGRQRPADKKQLFAMPVLALRLSAHANGVSKLHGEVSRRMWRVLWPDLPEEEVPITSVSNGVHLASWVSGDTIAPLLDRYLGEDWRGDLLETGIWRKIDEIPDPDLWRVHEQCRRQLVMIARKRLRSQRQRQGASDYEIRMSDRVLDTQSLTIGFSRRFAAYKRPTLILRNAERLVRLLSDKRRPVQIIFAGKAHPNDGIGRDLVHHVVSFAKTNGVWRRIVFIDDYDATMAGRLVQGSDIWLNTPRRPLEACGTSGMKAAANGVLNLSVLDGWWPEIYEPDIGWAIGQGEGHEDGEHLDDVESQHIYDLLEEEIIPLFYDRDENGLPRGWIQRMKASMRTICPVFNSTRMVREYCDNLYSHSLKQNECPFPEVP